MSTYPLIIIAGKAGSGKDTVGAHLRVRYDAVTIALADPMKRLAQLLFSFTEEQLWGPSECRNTPVFCEYIVEKSLTIESIATDFCHKMGTSILNPIDPLIYWYRGQLNEYLKNGKIAPRTVLQTLGTEYGRALDPDIWANYALKIGKNLLAGGFKYDKTVGLIPDKDARCDYVVITDGRFRNELLAVAGTNGIALRVIRPTQADIQVGVKGHQSEKELDGIPEHFYDESIVNNGTLQDLYDKVDTSMMVEFGDDRSLRWSRH
jgi:hypothetical protein